MKQIADEDFKQAYRRGKFNNIDFVLSQFTGNQLVYRYMKHNKETMEKPIYVDKYLKKLIDQYTEEALIGENESALIFAGPGCMPDEVLDRIRARGKVAIRFCGNGPYEANSLINDWIDERVTRHGIVCSSIWYPADSLAVGPYSAIKGQRVMLEDPQDLDSVAHAIGYVAEKEPECVVFVGDRTRFAVEDQKIIAKSFC